MTAFVFGETVTLFSRTTSGQDAYGNDTFTEVSVSYDNIPVFPRGVSVENQTDQRDTVFQGLYVVFPPGTVVTAYDHVIVRGQDYEVEGKPFEQVSPFTGWDPGVIVALRDVEG